MLVYKCQQIFQEKEANLLLNQQVSQGRNDIFKLRKEIKKRSRKYDDLYSLYRDTKTKLRNTIQVLGIEQASDCDMISKYSGQKQMTLMGSMVSLCSSKNKRDDTIAQSESKHPIMDSFVQMMPIIEEQNSAGEVTVRERQDNTRASPQSLAKSMSPPVKKSQSDRS